MIEYIVIKIIQLLLSEKRSFPDYRPVGTESLTIHMVRVSLPKGRHRLGRGYEVEEKGITIHMVRNEIDGLGLTARPASRTESYSDPGVPRGRAPRGTRQKTAHP